MTNYLKNLNFDASPSLVKRAKELRKEMTMAEKHIWKNIRGKKLGYKFRKQHPVYNYIADFYCHEKKLIIEIDGKIHEQQEVKEYDIERTKQLESYDIKVIRYKNSEVLNCLPAVIEDIKEQLSNR